jgi:hypothetical protein
MVTELGPIAANAAGARDAVVAARARTRYYLEHPHHRAQSVADGGRTTDPAGPHSGDDGRPPGRARSGPGRRGPGRWAPTPWAATAAPPPPTFRDLMQPDGTRVPWHDYCRAFA